MRVTLPTWLLLTATLAAAPTPYVDKKSAVADEAWMNARVKAGELLQSGQQLDPEGTLIDVSGRLLAIEFAQGGKVLVLKTTTTLATFEPDSFKLVAKAEFPVAKGGGSMHGLAIAADGETAVVSGGRTHLYVAKIATDGKFTWGPSIDVSGGAKNVNPLGVALTKDGRFAYVALSMANALAKVDLTTGKVVGTTEVGICPYGVALSPDESTAYVSNFGGARPESTDVTESSGGSLVAVDPRSVALRGTVSVVALAGTPKGHRPNRRRTAPERAPAGRRRSHALRGQRGRRQRERDRHREPPGEPELGDQTRRRPSLGHAHRRVGALPRR